MARSLPIRKMSRFISERWTNNKEEQKLFFSGLITFYAVKQAALPDPKALVRQELHHL